MARRIDPVLAAGQHRDRAGRGRLALCARASMPRASPETTTSPASPRPRASRSVKASPAAEALREPTIATAGPVQDRPARAPRAAAAPHRPGWRSRGIIRLAGGDEAAAEAVQRPRSRPRPALAVGGSIRRPWRAVRSGSAVEGAGRAAEPVDQGPEGARADAFGADQPQPIEPLGVGELHAPPPRSAHRARALSPSGRCAPRCRTRAGGCWARASTIAARP